MSVFSYLNYMQGQGSLQVQVLAVFLPVLGAAAGAAISVLAKEETAWDKSEKYFKIAIIACLVFSAVFGFVPAAEKFVFANPPIPFSQILPSIVLFVLFIFTSLFALLKSRNPVNLAVGKFISPAAFISTAAAIPVVYSAYGGLIYSEASEVSVLSISFLLLMLSVGHLMARVGAARTEDAITWSESFKKAALVSVLYALGAVVSAAVLVLL